MLRTISILVSGKVQGVYYRQSTREIARELGITGFVRNQPGDTVLIIATGTAEQLEQLTTWCRQGPPRARVDTVVINEVPFQSFPHFTIERH